MSLKEIIIPNDAQFIWCDEKSNPNDFVTFEKTFSFNGGTIEPVYLYIACQTRYYLYINGATVVLDGALFGDSMVDCFYIDKIDITKHLSNGENSLKIIVNYFGNSGRNNNCNTQGFLNFFSYEVDLFSDKSTYCVLNNNMYTPNDEKPSYLYGGDNLGYNANINLNEMTNAIHLDKNNFNKFYLRPINNFYFSSVVKGEVSKIDEYTYEVILPYAMWVYPVFNVINNESNTKIKVKSDRYIVNGGPGDEKNSYKGQYVEYICKSGNNYFESTLCMFCEKLIFSISEKVQIDFLGYIETSYDSKIVGSFKCEDDILNKLVEKSARTLINCMRDNFMDCPDRERGQWIGDVSVQVTQAMFLLDDNAKLLIKKCILDFINQRKGDVLVGNVPGVNFGELPPQSLNAISEIGLIANYYKYTNDKEVLKLALEPCVKYLMLWEMDEQGLLKPRQGNWRWFDHLYNVDEPVLENAWYYSALNFSKTMASILKINDYDEFLNDRIHSIKKAFHEKFYNGEYYTSGNIVDDRANALAVLSNLAPDSTYYNIRKILLTVFNSTVYMENYVLMALCEMGYIKDAYHRMRSRYYNLAVNDNSTLWEDFFILGTKNHAWSGSPATLAFKYFMGIDTIDGFNSYTVNPCKDIFKHMECTFNSSKGIENIIIDN